MDKIKFDIKYRKDIEEGKYKVYTSFGEPVQIVKWDCRGKWPILAVMFDGDTDDACFYDINGESIAFPSISYLYLVPVLPTWEPDVPETDDFYTWFVHDGWRIRIDDLVNYLPKKE